MGFCLTLGNELSQETRADKAKDLVGKGCPGGSQQGEGSQQNCSAMWLKVSGFMGRGLVSRLSLSVILLGLYMVWLRVLLCGHTSLSQGGFQSQGS